MNDTILCIGSATADHIFEIESLPVDAVKVASHAYTFSSGGMAANAAVAIARLGGNAAFCGRVGDDVAGRDLIDEFRRHGVDTGPIVQRPGTRTSVSAVLVDARGERAICNFRGAFSPVGEGTACVDLSAAHAVLGRAAAVLADVRWAEGALSVLRTARSQGVPSVLDADTGPQADLELLAAATDHVIFSAPGLSCFAPGLTPEAALDKALSLGCAMAAVTMGADGVLWRTASDSTCRTLPAFRVAAVETLAAGDVFHGAYALALAEQAARGQRAGDAPCRAEKLAAALRFAAAAAAIKCTRRGGREGMPSRTEVDALMSTA